MRHTHFLPARPASAEHILEVLRDGHRQQLRYDPEAEPDVELSMESTVADWRYACDLVGWRKLGHALNADFGIVASDAEWRAVLEPARERRLRGVCEFIAARAVLPTLQPFPVCGKECASAGAFLIVRSLLGQAGASLPDIRPSTPTSEYFRRSRDVFLVDVVKLAPGILPPVRIHTPWYDRAIWLILLGIVAGVLSAWLRIPYLPLTALAVVLAAYASTWILARQMPARVEFGLPSRERTGG
jgi:hypothetical protein